MKYTIADINRMTQAEFISTFGAIFEETPQIAQQTWHARPFLNETDLHQKMTEVVAEMTVAEQIRLIQAHPDLGSRVKMTEASMGEQAGAGLNHLSQEDYHQFQSLNTAYREKFGFPFVIAVKGQTKDSILAAFQTRLQHPRNIEIQQALSEINHIAQLRLANLI